MKVCSGSLLPVENTIYENAGTCAWWICVWAKSITYLLSVTVVSVAVRILVIKQNGVDTSKEHASSVDFFFTRKCK